MRHTRALFVVLLLALSLIAIASPAAQAHDYCVGHPSDASVVCVRDGGGWTHNYVDVCDRHADGHNAYARIAYDYTWAFYFTTGYDLNGSAAGCTTYRASGLQAWGAVIINGIHVNPAAVCVQSEGCSDFKDHTGPTTPASYFIHYGPNYGTYSGPPVL